MKIYIAGKITDNPDYKAEFCRLEHDLLTKGHIVLNPTILPLGMEYKDYIRICLSMIDCCDEVYLLPNWKDSHGARYEEKYARMKGKKVVY